jgi:chaperonin cofactor prefoldin
MSLLTGKQLAEIMETDVYYAIPYSVVEWLNTLKLNASSRLVLERVISAALQRPSRSDRHLQVRLSLSLISRLTSIKERTVINAMSHLSKLGITEKLDVNNNGTLYQINLSGKIVDMVKKRFKPKTSLAVKEDTPPTQEEGVDLSLEIEQVEQKLSEIKSKQRALSDGLPENFSPIQMLKGDVEFDMASLERLSQLSDIEDKLESKLSELKQEQSTFESSPQSPPDPIKRKFNGSDFDSDSALSEVPYAVRGILPTVSDV